MKPDIEITPGPGGEVCDFCSAPEVHVTYDVPDFEVEALSSDELASVSKGNWNACRECAALIDRNDWPGVADRVLAMMVREVPELKDDLEAMRTQLTAMYAQLAGLKKEAS